MMINATIEIVAGLLIIIGGMLAVIAAVGLLRLPDVLIRMHASTKVGSLSSGVILVATALVLADASVSLRAVAIIVFLIMTAPIAAHMIGRAAIRTGVPLWRKKCPGGHSNNASV